MDTGTAAGPWQVLALHPTYLGRFETFMDTILWQNGPLSVPDRLYIAVMAASRHQCRPGAPRSAWCACIAGCCSGEQPSSRALARCPPCALARLTNSRQYIGLLGCDGDAMAQVLGGVSHRAVPPPRWAERVAAGRAVHPPEAAQAPLPQRAPCAPPVGHHQRPRRRAHHRGPSLGTSVPHGRGGCWSSGRRHLGCDDGGGQEARVECRWA